MKLNHIYCGDSVQILKEFPSDILTNSYVYFQIGLIWAIRIHIHQEIQMPTKQGHYSKEQILEV